MVGSTNWSGRLVEHIHNGIYYKASDILTGVLV